MGLGIGFLAGCGKNESPEAPDPAEEPITAENMDDYMYDLETEIAAEEAAIEESRD